MQLIANRFLGIRVESPVGSAHQRGQRGFALPELMMAIVIIGGFLIVAMSMRMRGDDESQGRRNAEGMASFQQIAIQYVGANRASIEKAMQDGTDAALWCKLNVAVDGTGGTVANSVTLHTCAFDTTWLRFKNMLPAGVPVDAKGGRYAAIVRQIYSGATPTGGDDMLVVLYQPSGSLSPVVKDSRRAAELISGMEVMGGTGGLIPVGNMSLCTATRSSATYQACGTGWKVNLGDFVDAAQVTAFGLALPN